jgi:hypothetical protein
LRSSNEEREKHQPSLRQSGAGQLSSPSASATLLKSTATELRPDSLHSGISRHETASTSGGEPNVEYRPAETEQHMVTIPSRRPTSRANAKLNLRDHSLNKPPTNRLRRPNRPIHTAGQGPHLSSPREETQDQPHPRCLLPMSRPRPNTHFHEIQSRTQAHTRSSPTWHQLVTPRSDSFVPR